MQSKASVIGTRLSAIAGILALVAAIGVTLGVYQHVFSHPVNVTVDSPRAGLLLDKGADVRLRGLRVGEVRSAKLDGDHVVISLALNSGTASQIPADVKADVTASTVFGAKYVELVPAGSSKASIHAGAVIATEHITTETNDLLSQLQTVIKSVDPEKLNQTLTELATALHGRGAELGSYLSQLNTYLVSMNGSFPAIANDLHAAPGVAGTYAKAAPDLMKTLKNLTVTSQTLDTNSAALQALLVNFTSASTAADNLVNNISDPLSSALGLLQPVTAGLAKFSPEFPCLLHGLVLARNKIYQVAGQALPGVQILASLLPGAAGYKYPLDLPKIIPNPRVNCPQVNNLHPKRQHFDDGSHVHPDDSYTIGLNPNPLGANADYLNLVKSWFGQSGVDALIQKFGGSQ